MRSWNDISQFYHTDIWQWAWLSSSSVPLPFFGFKSFISSCSTIPILSTRNQHKTFLIKLFIYFPNQIIVYHFPSTSVSKEGGQTTSSYSQLHYKDCVHCIQYPPHCLFHFVTMNPLQQNYTLFLQLGSFFLQQVELSLVSVQFTSTLLLSKLAF